MSTAPFGFGKSRVVTDSKTGHVVKTFIAGPAARPEQVHRNFKKARYVHVVMEVYDKKGEASVTWDEQDMIPEDQTRYRALAARLNFLAVDRPDLLYAAKECSRRMSRHRNKDCKAIRCVCRYLIACPRTAHSYRWQDEPNTITVYIDSDWAGCRESRKPTSGACFFHVDYPIKAYSKTHANIALSSAEAA